MRGCGLGMRLVPTILLMLQSVLIHVNPATCIHYWLTLHEVQGAHWGRGMEEVILGKGVWHTIYILEYTGSLLRKGCGIQVVTHRIGLYPVFLQHLKDGLSLVWLHLHQTALEVEFNPLALHYLQTD